MADKPTVKEQIEATSSVVHQTFDDLEDIGHVVDSSKMTLEKLTKEFYKFKKDYSSMKMEIKRTIATEVEQQIIPLKSELAEIKALLAEDRKRIYLTPKLPSWLSWIFKFKLKKP